jgi:hypothetical protein
MRSPVTAASVNVAITLVTDTVTTIATSSLN